MGKTRVLVIEDAQDLCVELVDYLQFAGYDAAGVGTVAQMREALEHDAVTRPWQVLVLDLGLPDGDGLQAAQQMRAQRGLDLGIVMVTARGHVDDRIAGLRSGADAYLVKPVDLRELAATIDQLAKRLSTPGWGLDAGSRLLTAPKGQPVELTGAENLLLQTLMSANGQVLDREQLCRALAPSGDPTDTRRLDTLISRLRTKVEVQTGCVLPIQTFRNLGYAYAER